jgi:hypothetical protein
MKQGPSSNITSPFETKKGAIYEGDALKPPIPEEELVLKARAGMEDPEEGPSD